MTSELKKKYGLIVKKKEEDVRKPKVAAIFGDEEDDDVAVPATSNKDTSASNIRVQKAAQREHEKALAYDPSIFDYDANYDEIQAVKNQKKEDQKEADKKREPKYALAIIKANKRRQIETHSREERQQQREREKEGDEFADKEVFITNAYRKQQEEVQAYRAEESLEDQFNELTAVANQKMWQAGIGRTLLEDIAREEPTTFLARKKKERHERERLDSSLSPVREVKKEPEEEPKKKSIYSDDEDDFKPPPRKPVAEKKQQKNFEGELKPGLNLVTKKAVTKAEKVRQRNYTPTPPSSDDENDRRRERRRERDTEKKREKSEEKDEEVDVKEEKKISLKDKLKPLKANKEQRMNGLKQILSRRNNHDDVEAMRARYLQRKADGVVVPPL